MATSSTLTRVTTSSSSSSSLQDLRLELSQLKDLETELSTAKWNTATRHEGSIAKSSSPRGVADDSLLLERYEEARNLYLQRRMENLLVDHLTTYNPDATTADDVFERPMCGDDGDDAALQGRHDQALATLQTAVQQIQSQTQHLQTTCAAVTSRRQELEQIMDDLEQDNHADTDNNMDEDNNTANNLQEEEPLDEDALAMEQARIEQLLQTKRRLQGELAQIQQETKRAKDKAQSNQEQLAVLQQQHSSTTTTTGEPLTDLRTKVNELREMKVFYDSLREVLEELGGVKILDVHEQPSNRHLYLSLLLYDEFQVQVELQVYRKTFLKLVNAKWTTKDGSASVIRPQGDDEQDQKDDDDFCLPLLALDDLVQVATTTLGPPHDLRLIVRESLARIRIAQSRVDDLAVLRRQALTKLHNGNQVVVSLNDGIVVVMRLYEKYTRVEQIVGVSGWDETATQQLQDSLPASPRPDSLTCTEIIQHVQTALEDLKSSGQWNVRTPRFPERKNHQGGF